MTKELIFKRIALDDGYVTDKSMFAVEDDRELVYKAMDEYAKQQAIAFFKWNAKNISIYLDYLRRVDEAEGEEEMELELNHFENNSIEGRYTLFVENQFIEQQNKQA